MANKRNYKTHTNKGLAIFCVVLAFVIVAACTLGGLQLWGKGNQKPSNWFRSEDPAIVVGESVKYETTLPANGGMTLPDKIEDGETDDAGAAKSNGIALMSMTIPVSQYAAYEISPAAETARTVTATVSPDNEAANTKIKWELSWKDPASEWATGKEVTDYVSLQTNADDVMESKTCTVSCAQAFGEQIILKAIAVDDETKFATCNVDYIRQVKSATVSIGDISVNLGGNTDITIAIRRDYGGKGGKVTVTPVYGDVYTIENEFTAAASLTHGTSDNSGSQKWLAFSYVMGGPQGGTYIQYTSDEEVIGDSIYFDRRLFTQFKFYTGSAGWEGGDNYNIEDAGAFAPDGIKDLITNFNEKGYHNTPYKGKVLWTMKVTLTSGSYEYSYESDLVWAAIDETVPVGDVSITHDGAPGNIQFP